MKILLVQVQGVIAPHVISGYHKAFEKLGHNVIVMHGKNGVISSDTIGAHLLMKPDLIISYRAMSAEFHLHFKDYTHIPTVCLHYDNPYFSIANAQQDLLGVLRQENIYHFVWDASFRSLMRGAGFKNVYETMLAVDPALFYPENIDPTHTVGIVASFDKRKANASVPYGENVEWFIDEVIDQKIKSIGTPILEIIENLFASKSHRATQVQTLVEAHSPGLWEMYAQIHYKGGHLIRDHFARCMSQFETHIYGDTVLEAPNITIHPPVPYETELHRTYQKHKVIQNVSTPQLETSVNNRVFDVFASGGYVLSDYKQDMAVIFPHHHQALTFKNTDELLTKTEYYLGHDKERHDLIQDVRHIVLENHTYQHRAQSIIDTIFNATTRERFQSPAAPQPVPDDSLSVTVGGQQIRMTPQQITMLFHYVYYNSGVWARTHWCGHQILKCPLDMWIYQEIFWVLKPDFIIEAGTFRGGSALYYANLFDTMGHGKIISIDITAQPGRPTHKRITYLSGSSADVEIFNKVKQMIAQKKKVIVVLDSDHSKDHVLKELRLWWPMVNLGSYLIVEDSNVNGHPVKPEFGPGPMEAITEFMRENAHFEIDRTQEKFFMTQNPSGYLKRVR